MWNIRIRTAAGVVPALLLAGVTASSALAETAIWERSDHRVLLLKIVEQSTPGSPQNTASYAKSGTTKALKRHQLASRRWIRRHNRLAEKHLPELTTIAQAQAAEEILPAANTAPAPIELESPPRELAVDVRLMQVASSREVYETPLQGNQTLLQAKARLASRLAENFTSIGNPTDSAGVSEVASVGQRGGEPTEARWMLQVLATLGGATIAGCAAWFLISPTRERSSA
jgi:hypothetical protein